jgi:protein-arginine kinase activator protein McsA
MQQAIEEEKYERASELRDKIRQLENSLRVDGPTSQE